MGSLTHFDSAGQARMVDVGDKPVSRRTARASAWVEMQEATARQIDQGSFGKGDVLGVARLAGIMAAKRTWELIPLCHPLSLDAIEISFAFETPLRLHVQAMVQAEGRTGVEMEALTAVSVAALTIYDMCKSVDRAMVIGPIQLDEKSGGKSGDFRRNDGLGRPAN